MQLYPSLHNAKALLGSVQKVAHHIACSLQLIDVNLINVPPLKSADENHGSCTSRSGEVVDQWSHTLSQNCMEADVTHTGVNHQMLHSAP